MIFWIISRAKKKRERVRHQRINFLRSTPIGLEISVNLGGSRQISVENDTVDVYEQVPKRSWLWPWTYFVVIVPNLFELTGVTLLTLRALLGQLHNSVCRVSLFLFFVLFRRNQRLKCVNLPSLLILETFFLSTTTGAASSLTGAGRGTSPSPRMSKRFLE